MDIMDEYLVITLLRHGLTEENERHAYVGWSDVSLSKKGREQLGHYRSLGNDFDVYACSDLKRCVETAAALFPLQSFVKYPFFREMNFGEWEGKTFEELKDEVQYQKWLKDFFTENPPFGESFKQFTERIDIGWKQLIHDLCTNDLKKAIIVSHGGVIRYLLSKYAPVQSAFWDWKTPHNTAFELIWKNKKGRGEERCTLLREVILTENPNGSGNNTVC